MEVDISEAVKRSGSIPGHLLPGLFFIAFGLRWIYRGALLGGKERVRGGLWYTTRAGLWSCLCATAFPCFGIVSESLAGANGNIDNIADRNDLREVALEPFAKVLACVIGSIGEAMHGHVWLAHDPLATNNADHIAIYLLFGISGVADILCWRSQLARIRNGWDRPVIPEIVSPLCLVAAFYMSSLFFAQHVHGRDETDEVMHSLVAFLFQTTAGFVAIQYVLSLVVNAKRSVDDALYGVWRACRILVGSSSVFLGTWFCQTGVSLVGANRLGSQHKFVFHVHVLFAVHLAVAFAVTVSVLSFVAHCCRPQSSSRSYLSNGNDIERRESVHRSV